MHILILTSIYPSKNDKFPGSFIHDQALAIKKEGHQVGVLVPKYIHPKKIIRCGLKVFDFEKISIIDGIPVFRFLIFPIPLIHHNLTNFLLNRSFEKYTNLYGIPDILHAHFVFYGGLSGLLIKQKYKIPLVLTDHSSEYFRRKIPKYKIEEIRRVYASSNCTIAVSNYLSDRLTNQFNLQVNKVIPDLVDTEYFNLSDKSKEKKPFTFTIIGSLDLNKGHKNLIQAFSESYKKQKVILNIVGNGSELYRLKSWANNLGINDQVIFWGYLEKTQVLELLHKTDVLVSASSVETFGVTLIEALSCGIPVLSTRSGGPEEIITPANGLLIDNNETQSLSQGLRDIKDNIAFYNPETIREECIMKFSANTIAQKFIKVYHSL